MKPAGNVEPGGDPERDEATTGLPGFRTWRGVYFFVLGCLLVYIGLLAWLMRAFS